MTNSRPLRSGGHSPLTLLVGLVPLAACSTDDGESFRVVALDIDDQNRLVLSFSEAVADPAQVDPADFRLSMARSFEFQGDGESYVGTIYTGWTYEDVISVAPGPTPTQLILDVDEAVVFAEACEYIRGYVDFYAEYANPAARFDMAMFLHYAAGEVPIEAASGRALADIFPDWVLASNDYLELDTYGFHNPLRIPCP